MPSYYLRYRQRVHGPFSAEELREMAAKGQLTALHMLSGDRQQWTPALEVKGLFPEAGDDPEAAEQDAGPAGKPAVEIPPPAPPSTPEIPGGKNKTTAALLALVLGGVGGHDFYLGAWGWGLLSIPLLITGLPILRGVVDSLRLFTMARERFDEKFNLNPVTPWTSCWG